ncbi:MAG: aromatic ring-hydroxylating dioxygenase subunit alpha [Gammaproteobacteria bacterium]|nr:MAG: aromatic ring-hydroxylating dioxygenase subunit alpha [Gammaproteobacteria bacterium]
MSETLPHQYYHDATTWAWECEQVFRRHWWLIGIESELTDSGDYLAITLMKWPLVIVRDQAGELRAFYNLCRHRAGPLVFDGAGRCQDLVCRYHGWRYARSGELLKAPGFEGETLGDRAQLGLLPLRVQTWNGLLFVCLDESAPNLETWLGDILPIAARFDATSSMQFDGEVRKKARSNWKTYGDNSCEGYHVGMVHSRLGSSMLRESVTIDCYDNGEFVGFDVSYASGVDDSRAGQGFWIYKFPGLLLHFADFAFNAETVLPLAADAIELRRWFWSNAEKATDHGVDNASIRPNSERVMDEDVTICELVQRNLASGVYPGGRLSARQEPGTIYFQQLVRKALGGLLETEKGGAESRD